MSFEGVSGNRAAYPTYNGGRTVFDVTGVLNPGEPIAHKNAAEQVVGHSLNMTAQQMLAHKVDKTMWHRQGKAMGETASPRGYSQLLSLKNDQVKLSEVTPDKFRKAVSNNFSEAGKDLKAGNVGPQTFAKETLYQRNAQPVKDLFTGKSGANLGTNLLTTAGLGLVGFDVLKNTRDTYKDAKAREDGSFGSKVDTAQATAGAFGKYTARNAATWEAAGFGAAIGSRAIPITFKGVGLGGVLGGAIAGVAAQKVMNKVLKTGDKDPVQQRKARQKVEKNSQGSEPPPDHQRVEALPNSL